MKLNRKYDLIEDYREILSTNEDETEIDIEIHNKHFPNGFNFIVPQVYNGSITLRDCKISKISTHVNHFKDDFRLVNCDIGELELFGQWYKIVVIKNCIVRGKIIFTDSVFHRKVEFHKNDFLQGTNLFSKHKSYGSVQFKEGIEFY